jgi:uncharacterized protein (DUF697 family)
MTAPNPLEQLARFALQSAGLAAEQVAKVTDDVETNVHTFAERTTESIGRAVAPLVENPVLRSVAKLPMLRWVMAALGQVDTTIVQQEVQNLRQQQPLDTREQLAQKVIRDTTLKAGMVGLATNILPPVALSLFAVDIVAVYVLQAEMLYRIAAIYDLPLQDPARRGEVLAIYALSVGGTGVLKTALSVPELIPGIGAAVGASSDAALIFTLGQVAIRFYERKTAQAAQTPPPN